MLYSLKESIRGDVTIVTLERLKPKTTKISNGFITTLSNKVKVYTKHNPAFEFVEEEFFAEKTKKGDFQFPEMHLKGYFPGKEIAAENRVNQAKSKGGKLFTTLSDYKGDVDKVHNRLGREI
jgi:Zn-dependent oligopeptidase